MDLSIIVPFCNEYPQVEFTAQSILNELRGSGIAFELMMIDNWCDQAAKQTEDCRICGTSHKRVRDKSGGNIQGLSNRNAEMTYLHYSEKLSHWNAKNMGVRNSTGRVLWFCDAHCVVVPGSLQTMFHYYQDNYVTLNGTLHFPIAYMLDDPGRSLIYKLTGSLEKREFHYAFTPFRKLSPPYKVPCMSTCGMMMSREIYDSLGGWPEELGIYGGGENFVNFTLATLGRDVNIMPGPPLWHYAEKRGYHWYFDDYLRNRMIATYMFGGVEVLDTFVHHSKGGEEAKRAIVLDVLSKQNLRDHRKHIAEQQKIAIVEWWKARGGP